ERDPTGQRQKDQIKSDGHAFFRARFFVPYCGDTISFQKERTEQYRMDQDECRLLRKHGKRSERDGDRPKTESRFVEPPKPEIPCRSRKCKLKPERKVAIPEEDIEDGQKGDEVKQDGDLQCVPAAGEVSSRKAGKSDRGNERNVERQMPPKRMGPSGKVREQIGRQRKNGTKTVDHLPFYRIERVPHGMSIRPLHQQDVIEPKGHAVACRKQPDHADAQDEENEVERAFQNGR